MYKRSTYIFLVLFTFFGVFLRMKKRTFWQISQLSHTHAATHPQGSMMTILYIIECSGATCQDRKGQVLFQR